jgi:hypothetical protein
LCVATFNEEGVRIVILRQKDSTSDDAMRAKAMSQLLGGLLAALVGIDIEGEIDGARTIA